MTGLLCTPQPDPILQKEVYTTRIMPLIEEITGLTTRWNGNVFFHSEADVEGLPAYKARKEWDCGITIHQSFLEISILFPTLAHECFHAVSVGMEPLRFAQFRGYEEGIVEMATRQFGPYIAQTLNVDADFSARSSYQRYITLLEQLRSVTGKNDAEFVLALLQTPLANREQVMIQWAVEANTDQAPIRVLAQIASALRQLRGQP